MPQSAHLVTVGIGGAVGAVCRYLLQSAGFFADEPYYNTMAINIAGSLVIGVLFAIFRHFGVGTEWSLLIFTGMLGGFTTYSSFSLDTVLLAEQGQAVRAAGYVAATLAGGIAAAGAGVYVTDRLLKFL